MDEEKEILYKYLKASIENTKKKIADEEFYLAVQGKKDEGIKEYERMLDGIEILERLLDKYQKMLRKNFGE